METTIIWAILQQKKLESVAYVLHFVAIFDPLASGPKDKVFEIKTFTTAT
jgi:hypothetical protein